MIKEQKSILKGKLDNPKTCTWKMMNLLVLRPFFLAMTHYQIGLKCSLKLFGCINQHIKCMGKGRDEKHNKTSLLWKYSLLVSFSFPLCFHIRVVFLCDFHSCLVAILCICSSLHENKFYRKLLSIVSVVFF